MSSGPGDGAPRSEAEPTEARDFNGEPAELIAAVETEDWARVADIVRTDWHTLFIDHLPALRWAMRQIPPEVANATAILKVGRDLMVLGPLTGKIPDGPFPIDRESLVAIGRSPLAVEIVAAATARMILLRRAGAFRAAAQLADQIQIVTDEAVLVHVEQLVNEVPTIYLMVGMARQLAGDLEGSFEDFDRSYKGNRRVGVPDLARDAAGKAALSVALAGDLAAANDWLGREVALPDPPGWLALIGPVAGNLARAITSTDQLDARQAEGALERLRPLDPTEEYRAVVAFAFAHHGLVFREPTETLRQLRDARLTHKDLLGPGLASALLDVTEFNLLLATGRAHSAVHMLTESPAPDHLTLVSVRLRVLTGDLEGANTAALSLLATPHSPRDRMALLLMRALALHRLDDRARATECLAGATDLARRYLLASPFAEVPRELLSSFADQLPDLQDIADRLDAAGVGEVYPLELEVVELTSREFVLLQELAAGVSLPQIAQKQFVSVATVRSHRHTLYRKLDAHSRTEALARAYELGLL